MSLSPEHLARLRARARRLSPSAAEADDLLQEALLGYLEQCRKGARIEAPLPYLMTALRHGASAQRRMALRSAPLGDAEEPVTADGELPCFTAQVLQAISRLPEKDRDLLQMVIAGETRPSDLARRLGVPTGTVMSRLNRARGRLRAALGEGRP